MDASGVGTTSSSPQIVKDLMNSPAWTNAVDTNAQVDTEYDEHVFERKVNDNVMEHKACSVDCSGAGCLVDGGMALVDVASANDDGEITGLKVTAESPDDSSGKKTREKADA